MLDDGPAGLAALLGEAWARYRLPLAVTEVHLGGPADEQVRWLVEAWDAAASARRAGADVRAVTAWALLGSVDWPSLLTREDGHYEPGCFDVRGGRPVETPLAEAVRALAAGRRPDGPALRQPGWWRRPDRLAYPPVEGRPGAGRPPPDAPPVTCPPSLSARPAPSSAPGRAGSSTGSRATRSSSGITRSRPSTRRPAGPRPARRPAAL